MQKLIKYLILPLLILLHSCATENKNPASVKRSDFSMGSNQLLDENLNLIMNKKLGIISNKASVLSNGQLLLDTLRNINGINIKAIFSPEHGFYINTIAGKSIYDSSFKNIPVYSLYGKTKKLTAEKLRDVDLLMFDLQDIGTRFYTYISTLYYVLKAAAENNIPVIVLDRPDPIGGVNVEGPVLKDEQKSFIGIAPVPVVTGMTIGEIAEMFSGEGWIGNKKLSLQIIKMKGWNRSNYFEDNDLKWIAPSPNIPDVETAVLYPATGFLEGTNISEGRGTEFPFKFIGAPFINSEKLILLLDSLGHQGLSITPITFTPAGIPGKAEHPKYLNEKCYGIRLKIDRRNNFEAVKSGIKLLFALHQLYPEYLKFNDDFFDKLTGDQKIREMLLLNKSPSEIIQYWQPGLKKFIKTRNKYLLY